MSDESNALMNAIKEVVGNGFSLELHADGTALVQVALRRATELSAAKGEIAVNKQFIIAGEFTAFRLASLILKMKQSWR